MMHLLSRAVVLIRLNWRTVRTQLAVLYAAAFVALGAALLAVSGLLVGSSSTSISGVTSTRNIFAGRHLEVGPLLVFLGTVLIALALGWLIAGRFLRPLRTITATAQDISASNLSRRLGLGGREDEFTALAATLDDLFGRLEASFQAQRHFVANAAHELRTPLTAERTLLQLALADPDATEHTLRATCERVLALGEQQEHLIEALLTLASTDRGIERRDRVDLAELARTVIAHQAAEAADRGVGIDAALDYAPADGDPSLIASLLANLVENAIRHNVAGGQVQIRTVAADGAGVVSIRNTGAVIPPGEVDRLFQPFQRLGSERMSNASGHGLGLAIVRAIADVHGAALTASAQPGGGLDIMISFPARPAGR